VTLFVLPVLLLGVASRRPARALIAGTLLSAAIEATRAALPVLGRSCDTNDWLSITIGALVVALLARAALGLARRSAT
jgi:VanZ family protein